MHIVMAVKTGGRTWLAHHCDIHENRQRINPHDGLWVEGSTAAARLIGRRSFVSSTDAATAIDARMHTSNARTTNTDVPLTFGSTLDETG